MCFSRAGSTTIASIYDDDRFSGDADERNTLRSESSRDGENQPRRELDGIGESNREGDRERNRERGEEEVEVEGNIYRARCETKNFIEKCGIKK